MEPGPQFRLRTTRGRSGKTAVAEVAVKGGEHGDQYGVVAVSRPSTHYSYSADPSQHSGQGRLFNASHSPGDVDAFFSKGARHLFPTAVGAAVNESRARGWGTPVPSSSLSQFSAHVVQHLVNKGIVENPTGQGNFVEPSNFETWDAGHRVAHESWKLAETTQDSTRNLHTGEVANGRQTMRDALRAGTHFPGKSSSVMKGKQFKQLAIDD
jgi:hypothetical protein